MRLVRLNPGFVVMSAVQSLSKGVHDGKTLILNALAGHVITLPPATGAGTKLRFVVTVVPTSNSNIIKVQNSTDVIIGGLYMSLVAGGAPLAFSPGATDDTITMNRTATGGAPGGRGEWLEFEDVVTGLWHLCGELHTSITPTTPFTSGV